MQCLLYFFPEQPAEPQHPSAIQMRRTIVRLVIGHMIAALMAIVFVAISTFLIQLFFIVILYSSYMTLREC